GDSADATPADADLDAAADTRTSTTDGGPSGGDASVTTPDAGASALDAGSDAATLVGDWPIDEGSGNAVLDHSGLSHNGVLFGGEWTADRENVSGSALLFDGGAGGYVSIAGHQDFDRGASPAFTMSAWARFDETPSHDMFFSVSFGGKDSSYGIELVNATTLTYWDGNDHAAQTNIPSVVGAWHHFGVVVEGTEARVYLDGFRVNQAAADTTPRKATQIMLGHSSFGDLLQGAVDKARFHRRALSDAEMLAEKNR